MEIRFFADYCGSVRWTTLSKVYGVSTPTLKAIADRRTWTHVD